MANKEIKTRFRLEGEADFKRGIKEAADAIKVLDSEQKLAKAQFEATGDAQQYAAETARILTDKIKEQEKAVKEAQSAMDKLTAAGVGAYDKTMQQWKTKLANERTKLENYKTELDKLTSGADESKKELTDHADEYAERLKSIDEGITFSNVLQVTKDVIAGLQTIIRTAARAAKWVWNLETGAGNWADSILTETQKFKEIIPDFTPEDYQGWRYASDLIDTSVEDISSAMKKLQKNLASENEDVLKTFNFLGVNTREAGNKARLGSDVFWEVIDALGREEDQAKRATYAQKLLGESWTNLGPIIESGSKAYKEKVAEGKRDAAVSNEVVENLGKWNDAQTRLNHIMEATKMNALGQFAGTFEKAADAASVFFTKLNDYLNSEDGKKKIEDLNTSLQALMDKILGETGGESTIDSLLTKFGGLIDGVNEKVKALVENWDKIKQTINDILGFFGEGNDGQGNWVIGGGDDVRAEAERLRQEELAKQGKTTANKASESKNESSNKVAERQKVVESFNSYTSLLRPQDLNSAAGVVQEWFKDNAQALFASFPELDFWDLVKDKIDLKNGLDQSEIEKIINYNESGLKPQDWTTLGGEIATGITDGLANGIEEEKKKVEDAAADLADATAEAARNALDEHSPSRVFATIGENAAVGMAQGLWDRLSDVQQAARALAEIAMGEITAGLNAVSSAVGNMMSAASSRPVYAFASGSSGASSRGSASGSASGGTAATPNINAQIIMDKKTVGYLVAPAVDSAIGAIIQAQRG